MSFIDRAWSIFLWMPIFVGTIANKYLEVGTYYFDELPSDKECDDIENKYKWKHTFKVRN